MQVRRGTTRTVLLIHRWAVKVPTGRGIGVQAKSLRGRLAGFAAGILANKSEREWSGFAGWDGCETPVLHSWLFGLIQVYPRCTPLPPGFRGTLPVLPGHTGEMKPENFGLLGGRVVRLDYDMT